jgi:hypothetical protein
LRQAPNRRGQQITYFAGFEPVRLPGMLPDMLPGRQFTNHKMIVCQKKKMIGKKRVRP